MTSISPQSSFPSEIKMTDSVDTEPSNKAESLPQLFGEGETDNFELKKKSNDVLGSILNAPAQNHHGDLDLYCQVDLKKIDGIINQFGNLLLKGNVHFEIQGTSFPHFGGAYTGGGSSWIPNPDPITDFSPLAQLRRIFGDFTLEKITVLKDLEPFKNVFAVSGNVTFRNMVMKDFSALQKLTTVQGISIEDCNTLHSLDGLQNIKTCKTIKLSKLYNLRDISALAALQQFDSIEITSCPNIENMAILQTLEKRGQIIDNSKFVSYPHDPRA